MKNLRNISKRDSLDGLFENLKPLLRPKEVSQLLGFSDKTIYDWRYRKNRKTTPEHLFLKLNGRLFVRTDVLKGWMASENKL